MANWYCHFGNGSSTGYYAVAAWATGTAYSVGALVRQSAAPAVGSERVFVCVVAGTSHASTEPTWTTTRGGKTTDNTVTWQEVTGRAAMNGDNTDVPASSTVRSTNPGIGRIIKNNSNTHYFICDTAGTCGSGEPTYDTTAGNTTTDSGCTWRCLGAVGNFTTRWAAPFARLQTPLSNSHIATGDTIYVASSHAETQAAAMNLDPQSTNASPTKIVCIDDTEATAYVLATTATVTTTGANNLNIRTTAGDWYGINFYAGTGSSTANWSVTTGENVFRSCSFHCPVTGGTPVPGYGGSGGRVTFIDCAFTVGTTGAGYWFYNPARFQNCTFHATGSVPTTFMVTAIGVEFIGCDFSAHGSGKTLMGPPSAIWSGRTIFRNCRLDPAVTLYGSTRSRFGEVIALNSDNSATNYAYWKANYGGDITSNTVNVRSGGASDGTTPVSRKIVTNANASTSNPCVSDPIVFWNETTGSTIDIDLEVITDSGVTLNNGNAWIEVEYPGSSSYPKASFATNRVADQFTATANHASSSETWDQTGLSSPVKQKLTVSVTPQMKGPIYVRFFLARASTTTFFDPKAIVS